MNLGQLIIGVVFVVAGIILIPLGFFGNFEDSWWVLIYGIPMLIIGVWILLNKKEDSIEQIKKQGGKRSK